MPNRLASLGKFGIRNTALLSRIGLFVGKISKNKKGYMVVAGTVAQKWLPSPDSSINMGFSGMDNSSVFKKGPLTIS